MALPAQTVRQGPPAPRRTARPAPSTPAYPPPPPPPPGSQQQTRAAPALKSGSGSRCRRRHRRRIPVRARSEIRCLWSWCVRRRRPARSMGGDRRPPVLGGGHGKVWFRPGPRHLPSSPFESLPPSLGRGACAAPLLSSCPTSASPAPACRRRQPAAVWRILWNRVKIHINARIHALELMLKKSFIIHYYHEFILECSSLKNIVNSCWNPLDESHMKSYLNSLTQNQSWFSYECFFAWKLCLKII